MTDDDGLLAWWVCWNCGCDDAQVVRDELPDKCPHHDRSRVCPPEPLNVIDLGHRCASIGEIPPLFDGDV